MIPNAVKRGDNAILQCRYDLEGDSICSVNWDKGRWELFRYTPKENPSVRTELKVVGEFHSALVQEDGKW